MRIFALLLAAAPLHAAYLQTFVVDADTGRALARTVITVESAQGSQAASRISLRTDRAGLATFGPIADGAYTVTISRAGFATQQYGQTAWNRPGLPVNVQGDRPTAIQIRLRRLPSISGALWDENQVGIPNAPVVVYTAVRPIKLIARANTDDRGIYRIGELVPGRYFVRSAARLLEDGLSIVPTFYPDGDQITQARAVDIDLDHFAQEINFAPNQGKLFHLTGRVIGGDRSGGLLELISDTGRVSTGFSSNGNFSFDGVAPGRYELFTQTQRESGWVSVLVDRDLDGVVVNLLYMPPARFTIFDQDRNRLESSTASVFARRKDLDADGPVIPVVYGSTVLAPGNWELAVSTPPTYYPVAITQNFVVPGPTSRADGWTPFSSKLASSFSITLSTRPATLHGRVVFSTNNPAPNVPVFLETDDLNPEEPPLVRTARTDALGNYRFAGLPPGRYRVVSTYDADPTDRAAREAAHPQTVVLKESADEARDLDILVR